MQSERERSPESRRACFAEIIAVAEPAGAAAFATCTRYPDALTPPVVDFVSGGDVDPSRFAEVTRG